MTIEQLREKGWIIYECIAGSHAYGTNIEGSDTDIRGVFIQPTDDILAGKYIEQVNDRTNDVTFYEIERFISLLCGGNPNILDILGTPKDCIIHKSDIWDSIFPDKEYYLTKKLKNSFVGYAHTQIKKAKGLKKKINWDKTKVVRKDIIDFCKILPREIGKVLSMKKWLKENEYKQEHIGLTAIEGFHDCYKVYTDDIKCTSDNPRFAYKTSENRGYRGIGEKETNEPRTSIIEKYMENSWKGVLQFSRDAYSTHCKDYREYQIWLEKRNPHRYADNLKGEQGYDHKNMMHCMRLLMTAKDIAEQEKLVIKRPEREYLLSIRNGKMKYDNLLDSADKLVDEIKFLFDNSDLKEGIPREHQQELMLKIRKL